jgi:pimeloyl-ACP methyl ester carboxylesterase
MLRPRGPATRPVLFVQGGGAGAHDQWDDKLVASLSGALGKGWRVRYPRLPDEADPSYAGWAPAIRAEILASREAIKRDTRLLTGSPLPRGDKPLALVGHSLGGTILAAALAEEPPTVPLAAIVLVSAPFVGDGGWPEDGFALPADLGAKLPPRVPVHIFHGLADDTAPPAHADLWARAILQAVVHKLEGRDHQLNDDLGEVAAVLRGAPC